MTTPDRQTRQSGAEGRTAIKTWLRENGVTGSRVDRLSMDELNAVWLDLTNETFEKLLHAETPARQGGQPLSYRQTPATATAAELMAQALAAMQSEAVAPLDESRVIELIRDHTPRPVDRERLIVVQDQVRREVSGRQHYLFPLVVKALAARVHVWLVGPAGSGKTSLVGAAAAALGLEHAAISVCGQTTKTDLLGYMDAHGVYRGTSFRDAYENGKVFCLDEADNGNANVLAVLNSALANGSMGFPDATVKRHANFVVVSCANTFGTGATAQYVGRNPVDAATLDRFFFLSMPYDQGLEASFLGIEQTSPALEMGRQVTPEQWLVCVRTARDVCDKHGIKQVISPRASLMGAALIVQGVGLDWLMSGLLLKSLPAESAAKLKA